MRKGCRWLGLGDVARICGAGRQTVHDWVKRGIYPRGGGERVKLRVRTVGARMKTRKSWLREFQRIIDGEMPTPPSSGGDDQDELAARLAGGRAAG